MKIITAVLSATAALALAACGPVEGAAPATETVTATATETETTPTETEPAPEPASSSYDDTVADPADDTVPFGETFEWEDGVKVMIETPTAFTPTEWAAGGEGYEHHVKMKVTIVNDSDAPLDASFASPTVQSGQREGDEVFDTDNGLEGAPLSSVLPGRTVTFHSAYGIDDPSDIVAEFAPTWDHDYAYWTAK